MTDNIGTSPPQQKPDRRRSSKKEHAEIDRYLVQVIDKAFDIMELLHESSGPISLAEITKATRYSKSTLFRILHTLEQRSLIEKKSGDLYVLTGPSYAIFTNSWLTNLKEAAEPCMQELAWRFRESVSLAVLFEDHIGVMAVVNSPQKISMGNIVRGIIPPHASSLGKCILAHQPRERKDHIIRVYGICAFTQHTIIDEGSLEEELHRVYEQGYAIDREESTLGGCCFGAPISGGDGAVSAAISISFPIARVNDEETIIEGVCQAAAATSAKLLAM